MSEAASVITAICMVLTVIGGLSMWFINFFRNRTPVIGFSVEKQSGFSHSGNQVRLIKVIPGRIKYPYKIVNITSTLPLYEGIYVNGHYVDSDINFSLADTVFVPSENQLSEEIKIYFFITPNNSHQPIKVQFDIESERFPFKWKQSIEFV